MTKRQSDETDVLIWNSALQDSLVALTATVSGMWSAAKDMDQDRYMVKQEALEANIESLRKANDKIIEKLGLL